MSSPSPRVVSIRPDLPFLDTLAGALPALAAASPADPLAITRALVFLPTRRACRAFQDAVLRTGDGNATLLPRIIPLGDVDADDTLSADPADPLTAGTAALDPAIDPMSRLCLLTRLVQARDRSMSPAQAVALARDLAGLLDEAHGEDIDFYRLPALADRKPEFAEHWQRVLDFLGIVTSAWPEILAAEGALDPAEYRKRAFDLHIAHWRQTPPTTPVIAAGSTGSHPATARLLACVARLPNGLVVLPGLDDILDAESWAAVDDTHPQAALKRLLRTIGIDRSAVAPFPNPAPVMIDAAASRAALVSTTFLPAETTDRWRDLTGVDFSAAFDGLTLVEAPTRRDEANAIATVLRGTLETAGKTAALVTPDRTLARRVSALMARWDVTLDDSAGQPLSKTPVGLYLRLAARLAAGGLGPVALLSFLEHPLTAGGEAPGRFRARIRRLNRDGLRGPKPPPGLEGLRARIAAIGPDRLRTSLSHWLERFSEVAVPFLSLFDTDRPTPVPELLEAHMRFSERMADARVDDGIIPGALRLWSGDAGAVAAGLMADLSAASRALDPIPPSHYPALFEAFLDMQVVRPRRDTHPNLFIWGPLEARLQRPDVLILGGLNEGTWPRPPETGPWLSRPMRADLGLPSPERRIGLSAHDIAQFMNAPTVVLTRALRVDGSPGVASRWLTRLETVATAANAAGALNDARQRGQKLLVWSKQLEQPPAPPARTGQPAPCPPVSARPRALSVTRIETWMRDPYALYARFILGLRELDPLEADPSRADYGTLIHRILEEAVLTGDIAVPDRLLKLGQRHFSDPALSPGVRGLWEPRFHAIARWVAAHEAARAPLVQRRYSECTGRLIINAPAGPFVLTAKADRLDLRRDGSVDVIDYKTGTPPSSKEVAAGFAPQLPLEIAILTQGGFADLGPRDVADAAFWHLGGGRKGGEARSITPARGEACSPAEMGRDALEGLMKLVETFDDPNTPYVARPHPAYAPRFNPYQHLARVAEWSNDPVENTDASR